MRKKGTKEGIKAASATYRKATNAIADTIGVNPEHTGYPKEDFEEIINKLDGNLNEVALKFYRLGLRRGMIKATDMVVDGTLKYDKGILECPGDIEVKVKIKMPNEDIKKKKFTFKPKSIGFE